MIKKVSNSQQQTFKSKINKEYFNFKKKGHYSKDYYSNIKRKPKNKKVIEKAKQAYSKRNQIVEKALPPNLPIKIMILVSNNILLTKYL